MARYYRAEDGALQLLGAYDRERAQACAEPASVPGVCAPSPLWTIERSNEYADPACTISTTLVSAECADPAQRPEVGFVGGGDPCLGSQQQGHFYRLGDQDTERPFLKNGDVCAQSTSPKAFPASNFRYVLGDEIPATAFPALRTVDEGKGRLKVRTVETPDGQHLLPKQIFDAELGATCTPTRVGDKFHCLPDITVAGNDIYTDAACTHLVYGTACATPKFVTLPPADCGGAPRYYEVGPPVMTDSLFFKPNGGVCTKEPGLGGPYLVHELMGHVLDEAPVIAGD
jgi:hypothetical protein